MREAVMDLWAPVNEPTIICITTNGSIRRNGRAVIGAGCAREACERFPALGLPQLLADSIALLGLHCYCLKIGVSIDGKNGASIDGTGGRSAHNTDLWVFPTKHDWRDGADIELIKQSAYELAAVWWNKLDVTVRLPQPGCGLGGLEWESVRKVIEPMLPDNVVVVSR